MSFLDKKQSVKTFHQNEDHIINNYCLNGMTPSTKFA